MHMCKWHYFYEEYMYMYKYMHATHICETIVDYCHCCPGSSYIGRAENSEKADLVWYVIQTSWNWYT